MTSNALYRAENRYMPLKLKTVMAEHHLSYKTVCPQVLQMNGKQISEPAFNLLLNWGTWPAKTPQDSIRKQVETVLIERGVPPEKLADIWDADTPLDGHNFNTKAISRERAAERTARIEQLQSLEAEMLSKEAKIHFEVPVTPFSASGDDVNSEADIFMTREIRAAYQALYHCSKHAGIVALVCESGGGKSVIRRWLDNTIRERQEPIRLLAPLAVDKRMLTAGQICEAIIRDLDPNAAVPASLERRARKLRDMLEASKEAGNANVLVIEEAHDLSLMMFKHLKRFWEMEKGFTKLLGIILVGQPELKTKLDARINFEAREFINRCEVFELSPLGPDLEAYIEFKLKRAGVTASRIFAKDAYDAIRQRLSVQRNGRPESLLYPLYVHILITKAMNLCARIGAPRVNADVISKL